MVSEYSIVIPSYNEERAIGRAIQETVRVFDALHAPYEVLVVDDGSSDQTAAIVQESMRTLPQLKLIQHPANQGKGAAVRTGVQATSGHFFLFLDADLATHPSEFEKVLPALQHADIVIGSRTTQGSVIARQQPIYRVLLGKVFNRLVVRWYLGLPFFDTQCGFKVFHQKAKPLFENLQSSGWAFDVELLLRAKGADLRIAEVPVKWRHGRESRVRLRDVFQILRELRGMK